ncbi:hypothetical protein LOD99_7880 [Oopsacas minuta]|uniref:Uncharacterized protein n=1 Tax=Oopsacas minuta TaxID=111878 RepID=A0AAV7JQT2_9METZ|nr:hypothetical protein LOD99_7880 [Oopsacas minuta]
MTTENNIHTFSPGTIPNNSFSYKSTYPFISSNTKLDPDLQDSLTNLYDAISSPVRDDINPTDIHPRISSLNPPDRITLENTGSFAAFTNDELKSNTG